MLCLKVTFVVLILACLAQQSLQAEARKGQQERKGRGRVKQDVSSPKPTLPSRRGHEKRPKGSGGHPASKGQFSTKDKMQCSWVAAGDQALILRISCSKGNKSFNCEYTANPGLCHQYESSSGRFRKKIARSLRKQKNLCQDPKAAVKVSVCKNVRKEVHFSLRTPTEAQHPPQSMDCKGLSDRSKLAKEYCSNSWSSVCTFFFAMVESEGC